MKISEEEISSMTDDRIRELILERLDSLSLEELRTLHDILLTGQSA